MSEVKQNGPTAGARRLWLPSTATALVLGFGGLISYADRDSAIGKIDYHEGVLDNYAERIKEARGKLASVQDEPSRRKLEGEITFSEDQVRKARHQIEVGCAEIFFNKPDICSTFPSANE